jgi:branched-chain amino acid aminotransferase
MRRFLLENLDSAGFPVVEQSLFKKDLVEADEVFLSNAIYGIKWVKQFEERLFSQNQTTAIHANLIAPLWAATK